MPWNNQGGGGPWGGGGGGGGPKGPWGQGPQGGGGGGGGQPPDLEDLIRKSQERLKGLLPGGGGNIGAKGIALIAVLGMLIYAFTGFYTVSQNEVGVNTVFGRHIGNAAPGLNWNPPAPFGAVYRVAVTDVRRSEIGYRSGGGPRGGNREVLEESLMLTGDENIVDIDLEIQWDVNAAQVANFIFQLQNPEGTVKSVGESALREVIGRRNIQPILTTDQSQIAAEVRQLMQKTLDDYRSGVNIRVVQLVSALPPAQVRGSFLDVNAAQQDQNRVQNEARTYANQVVPEARGRASQIMQEAEAYRERVVAEANGQASRFRQVYEEYRRAPEVTRERMFLETMERIFAGTDKIIIDQPAGGQGVQPFLPLDQINRRPAAPATPGTQR
ncbi:FtsH protease activity modulator HflK [Phreatobacter aquaticus]|uniref:Protein HflK n=1 Tax=Phreatobacter aquaticus TaxID=2570229 RepID=A0A4D7QH69_9HYPH|nr:FtsH protease activity modulator HflK [Phreatobacter aquaticus]QCK86051.1 FtsH protease activity modulator HflK [Phreatobacter aquaticus]